METNTLLLGDCADKMRDTHYFDIASRRIAAARPTPTQQELPL